MHQNNRYPCHPFLYYKDLKKIYISRDFNQFVLSYYIIYIYNCCNNQIKQQNYELQDNELILTLISTPRSCQDVFTDTGY